MTPERAMAQEPDDSPTARFVAERARLAERAWAQDADGLALAEALSAATDRWLLELWALACPDVALRRRSRLFALGGYGRRELSFHSDLDLVIELEPGCEGARYHGAVERLMQLSRVERLKLSHAVRTPEQAEAQMHDDWRTPVSMLDMRALAPDDGAPHCGPEQARAFLRGHDEGVGFVANIIRGVQARMERCGETVYLLEPDLKQGVGGLRDLHALHWAMIVRHGLRPRSATRDEVHWTTRRRERFAESLSRLLAVRHRLHLLRGRKYDRLQFPDQEHIALRRRDGLEAMAVVERVEAAEDLMRELYRVMRSVHGVTMRFLRRSLRAYEPVRTRPIEGPFASHYGEVGLLEQPDPDAAPLSAGEVLRAFELAQDQGVAFSPWLEEEIARSARSPSACGYDEADIGRRMARFICGWDPRLHRMSDALELGLMARLMPEFEAVVCHVQHDTYHIYTTDVHLLHCLERARAVWAGDSADPVIARYPQFVQLAEHIDDAELLLLAALLHDVGKNRGGDHSELGARLIEEGLGARLGLDGARSAKLAALVRHHLLLNTTARRRDIAEPAVIEEVAEIVRDRATLHLLTVLTFCDMSTVGPSVISDWTVSLLLQLHHRVEESLGGEVGQRVMAQRAARRTAEVVALLAHHAERDVREVLDDLPRGHLVMSEPEALARQVEAYRMSVDAAQAAVLCTTLEAQGCTEIIVASPDAPGVLAQVAGALASAGLDILTAQIVTTSSLRALDIFQVRITSGLQVVDGGQAQVLRADSARAARLIERLSGALHGTLDIRPLLRRRLEAQRLVARPQPAVAASVQVIADSGSGETSLVEVRAADRPGLLYDIASTLTRFGVNTVFSKIDSLGAKVVDIFYVTGPGGGMLSACEREALREALSELLCAPQAGPMESA